jgi:hypothetical protein
VKSGASANIQTTMDVGSIYIELKKVLAKNEATKKNV